MGLKYEAYKPADGMPSAHYKPLPDIGDWKFESDFTGDQFRYTNPRYDACISWIKRRGAYGEKGWTRPVEWRIIHNNASYDTGANGRVRQFKTPERAIKALELDYAPIED